jgi:hypothetical protein
MLGWCHLLQQSSQQSFSAYGITRNSPGLQNGGSGLPRGSPARSLHSKTTAHSKCVSTCSSLPHRALTLGWGVQWACTRHMRAQPVWLYARRAASPAAPGHTRAIGVRCSRHAACARSPSGQSCDALLTALPRAHLPAARARAGTRAAQRKKGSGQAVQRAHCLGCCETLGEPAQLVPAVQGV